MDSLRSSLPKQNTRQKQGNPEVGRRALRANENGTHVFYNQSRSQSGQGEGAAGAGGSGRRGVGYSKGELRTISPVLRCHDETHYFA